MVQKSIDNSFKNVRFSYDLGQPNELCIVVFVNNMRYRRGEPNFTILFRQKENGQYNILDNPEKFIITIE